MVAEESHNPVHHSHASHRTCKILLPGGPMTGHRRRWNQILMTERSADSGGFEDFGYWEFCHVSLRSSSG
jgi:hypothetical protein